MRSKNSKPLSAEERDYLALVKQCACVICQAPPPSSAHHLKQGLHLVTIALCWEDHQGPHGWHGDKSRWRVAKMTELQAANETARAVLKLRSGGSIPTPSVAAKPRVKERRGTALTSSKIIPRAA